MSAYVSVELRRQVRQHFRDSCAYCRTAESLTVAIFEIEHIEPVSVGGKTIFENLCLACPTCNRCKSNRTTASDMATQQQIALFHPHKDEWTDHFAWSDDASEIIPQTATGRVTIDALRMNRSQLVRVRRMWVALGEHPPFGD